MQMQMSSDSRTGCSPEVHAEIHPIWFVSGSECCLDTLGKLHHFCEGFGFTQLQFRDVRVRHDHDVSGGVGVAIQNDKRFCSAMNDQRFRIVIARDRVAKNTFRLFVAGDPRHVLVAPGCPDVVHRVERPASPKTCAHSITQNRGAGAGWRGPQFPLPGLRLAATFFTWQQKRRQKPALMRNRIKKMESFRDAVSCPKQLPQTLQLPSCLQNPSTLCWA